jgi:hypothetical protein
MQAVVGFQSLSGAAFDRQFPTFMALDHQADITAAQLARCRRPWPAASSPIR